MRVFLSYQTQDRVTAQRLYTALLRRRPTLEIFFDRERLLVGDVWQQKLADELAAADALLLLLGRRLGPWQEREFEEAQRLQSLAGHEGRPRIMPIALTAHAPLPAFAALYHHVAATDPDSAATLDILLAALDRTGSADATPDWERINPYKGLAALTAADAAFFFGREAETAVLLERIRQRPGKVLTLVGNSGVGKSSLIQAGVIDALRTQRWPGTGTHDPGRWIGGLTDCHRWSAITFRPGDKPVLALTYAFLTLVMEPSAALEKEATEWAGLLMGGTSLDRLREHVGALLASTGAPTPKRFLVYIDQGEELYARSAREQRVRFSSLIAEAAGRREFQILSSLRSDYYGRLQDDLTLFQASERLDLPPMAASDLARAIGEPARLLGVRFEPADAPDRLAALAAQQSGALPLLSDLMAELWREMRHDGILDWSQRTDLVDVGRPLSARADRYLVEHPDHEDAVRTLFTLRLVHVPTVGEPVRRRALRSECGDEQWKIVETLSNQDWRLLTVSEDAATHEPTVEVAHEQLLRSWTTLRDWLKEGRDFLAWKGTLEQARLDWLASDKADNALLLGAHLTRALYWRTDRESDLNAGDLAFIEASEQRQARAVQKEREDEARLLRLEQTRLADRRVAEKRFRAATIIGMLIAGFLAMLAGYTFFEASKAEDRALAAQSRQMAQAAKNALTQGDYGTALALGIEALPRVMVNKDRPYLVEAEHALQEIVRNRPMELAVLRGPEGSIDSAMFSPDGARVVTVSQGKVQLWEAASSKGLTLLTVPPGKVQPWEAIARDQLGLLPKDHMYSAVFSPDGARVLTASEDTTARLWEAASGKELVVLRGHDDSVDRAVFSPDGARVLTASKDMTARLWEAASGKELAVLRGHEDSVRSAVFSPDGGRVLTASDDKTVRLWEAANGRELAVLRGHEGSVWSAVFSPDGGRVLTASEDKTARLWEAASGKELAVLRGHEGQVSSAVFSADGARVLTASADGTARLWEAASGNQLAVLRGHEDLVYGAVFSPDGARVLTASADGTARLWEAANGRELAVLRGHEDLVYGAVFSADGARVLTASADGTARLWEAASGRELAVLRGHEDQVYGAVFSPDGARVLTASADKTARVWEAASGNQLAVLRGHGGLVWRAVFSADGARVLTASADGTARLWEAANGRELAVLRGHEDQVRTAEFSPDGARVLTSSWDKTARLWEATSGKELAVLRGHKSPLASAVFSPDGARVLTASGDRTARLWEATSGKELAVLRGHEDLVESAVFSPDGARVLTASNDMTARLWEAASGKELAVLRGHERWVRSAVFSPDGARVLTTSWDRTARLWEAASGKELVVLRGHDGSVDSAVFSPDGARVLTASADGTARLWEVASGKELAVLRGHERGVASAVFSADGARVLTASEDMTARVWENYRTTQELIDRGCALLPRPLTHKQRKQFFLEDSPKEWPCGWSPDTDRKPVYSQKAKL